MSSAIHSVCYGKGEHDIAEISPNCKYLRYNGTVQEESGRKVCYMGFDEDFGRDVTWKKIQVDDSFKTEQLLQESIQFLKDLKHNNIVKYYTSWVDHTTSHINLITESFTSGCLRKFRSKHKNVRIYAIKKWARQILKALCFLHTHNPPIVHGNLTCDNIFINGNTGEVKIGDLGIWNILQDPQLELSGKEFKEDFDVYSFGICMLELATSQSPLSEFETLRDMYWKRLGLDAVSAILAKVKDVQFKEFIQRCFGSGSVRVSELLEDSFLQMPTLTPSPSSSPDLLASVSELRRIIGNREFTLKGERRQQGSVLFQLHVNNSKGQNLGVEFEFDPRVDTTLAVAREMTEVFYLSSEEVILVAQLMDSSVFSIVPCWESSISDSLYYAQYSCGDLVSVF